MKTEQLNELDAYLKTMEAEKNDRKATVRLDEEGISMADDIKIEGHLKMHHHDGLVKKGKLRSSKL